MIIIPARLKSSRFENKILADINGLPMVIRTAKRVEGLDNICIATDSQEVIEIANKHGFNAVLTSISHQSGTDRINEAANLLNLPHDEIIINVQADEPYIERSVVEDIIKETKKIKDNPSLIMVSCYKSISEEDAKDPNHVKVVVNKQNNALYFSRSKIPHHREDNNNKTMIYNGHLGIYGFTVEKLNEFCNHDETELENIEKLEQLRALDYGYDIKMIKVESNSFGIDTKEDLTKLLKLIKKGEI